MKHNKSLFVCSLLLILSSAATHSQYYYSEFIKQTITLRSDDPSKSVLVSNLLADKFGDMSPYIISANWNDKGRQLECRSLLQFNYILLPDLILTNPSIIISAELILYPLQVPFSENDLNKPVKFTVRRVLDDWNDSATMWINQPVVDSNKVVTKIIKNKDKNKPVKVDVTDLVTAMIQSGNNGFMICPEGEKDETLALGQLFASPKNEDENIRPVLVIRYRQMIDPNLSLQKRMRDERQMEEDKRRFQGQGYGTKKDPTLKPVVIPEQQPAPVPINPVPVKN